MLICSCDRESLLLSWVLKAALRKGWGKDNLCSLEVAAGPVPCAEVGILVFLSLLQ